MKKPAVFLDRDGTINEQMGYINHISRFVLLPGVSGAIRELNRMGYHVIVLSNQSGVARGYFPIQLVEQVNLLMKRALEEKGALLDAVYFCPHYPKGTVRPYAGECDCRKPKTGLIDLACNDFEIDLKGSFMVGDRCDDIKMAVSAGIRGILVKSGYGKGEVEHVLPKMNFEPFYIAEDLPDAVNRIKSAGDR